MLISVTLYSRGQTTHHWGNMSDFGDKLQSAFGELRRNVKRRFATDSHREASNYLEQGRKKYNDKKYKEALKLFQAAVDADGHYALAQYYLGLALYKTNDSEAAIRAWNRVIVLETDSDLALKANNKLEQHARRAGKTIEALKNRLKG